MFLKFFKQCVQCHLEIAVSSWFPWLRWEIEILERVQKRAVNFIVGLKRKDYADLLKELGLKSLEDRRGQLGMIQTYKINKGIDNIKTSTWFKLVGDNATRLTRNTAYCANLASRSRTDLRKNFFSNRVINTWNALPQDKNQNC